MQQTLPTCIEWPEMNCLFTPVYAVICLHIVCLNCVFSDSYYAHVNHKCWPNERRKEYISFKYKNCMPCVHWMPNWQRVQRVIDKLSTQSTRLRKIFHNLFSMVSELRQSVQGGSHELIDWSFERNRIQIFFRLVLEHSFRRWNRH